MIILIIIAFFIVVGLAQFLSDEYGWSTWSSFLLPIAVIASIAVFIALFVASKTEQANTTVIAVKYRDTMVNVGGDNFESTGQLDNTVRNVWYDAGEKYLIIRLGNTNYHYCEVPKNIWVDFKNASSPYAYYSDTLRGNYDCRTHYKPAY